MDKQSNKSPYRPLGRRLKTLRDRANESLAEASGAVEIDVRQLASYELGQDRPSEETLLLLISHFGAQDDEAVRLWELAGYGVGKISTAHMTNDNLQFQQLNDPEKRVLFTDTVDIVVNNYGVVMNFMQSGSPGSKPASVARVGMSREHAKSVLEILKVTLAQTERAVPKLPKKIIAPDNNSPDDSSRS